jgi:hypothetical protein
MTAQFNTAVQQQALTGKGVVNMQLVDDAGVPIGSSNALHTSNVFTGTLTATGISISDPTTPSQQQAVNASGEASAVIADGSLVTLGAKADVAANADTGTFSAIAILKRIVAKLTSLVTNTTGLAQESGGNLASAATSLLGLDASTATVAIASGHTADTVVKASAGRLARVLVTTTNTTAMQIFDNASAGSGKVIGYIPANPTAGNVYTFHMPAALGVTVKGDANNPGVTVSYA